MARDDFAEAAHRLLIEGFDELPLTVTTHQLDTLLLERLPLGVER